MAEGWTFEQRCVQEATPPPADWTFDGTIFMYESGRGIKAFRSDMPQSYFIAFSGGAGIHNYNAAGRFSPDGKWYAVPAGEDHPVELIRPISDRLFVIKEIRVFTTGSDSKLAYRIPWNSSNASSGEHALDAIVWKNNTAIIYPEIFAYQDKVKWYLINPFNGAKTIYSRVEEYIYISPDNSLGISYTNDQRSLKEISTGRIIVNELPEYAQLLWLNDSSGYLLIEKSEITEFSETLNLNLYNRDGQLLEASGGIEGISHTSNWVLNKMSNRYLAANVDTNSRSIYIVDLEQKQIVDLCVSDANNYLRDFHWSPTGNQLLLRKELENQKTEIHIIDWQHEKNYLIEKYTSPYFGSSIEWYPNEKTPTTDSEIPTP